MNNQFVGDIGDYTKLGLLRELEWSGFSIGINWYLTPDVSRKTGGGHTGYLDERKCGEKERNKPDPDLVNLLRSIRVYPKTRSQSVDSLMDAFDRCSTKDYRKKMEFTDTKYTIREQRESWHKDALNALSTQKIVFLDPDNALQAGINPYDNREGHLYASYQEVADYYKAGTSVIVYNHLPIKSKKQSFIKTRLCPMLSPKFININANDVFCLEAPRRSVRFYLILAQLKHSERIRYVIRKMLEHDDPGWRSFLEDKSKWLRATLGDISSPN